MADPKPFTTQVFKDSDLQAFAALSGDRNPLHMDPLAARRTPEGVRVVHGMLLALYGLDRWAGSRKKGPPIQRIQCAFKKPVLIGEKAEYFSSGEGEGPLKISVFVEGLACAEIILSTAEEAGSRDSGGGVKEVDEKLSGLAAPLEWEKDDFPGFSAVIRNPLGPRLEKAFPRLCKVLGAPAVSALVRLSYIVGMVCPGLHSLFSSLDVRVDHPPSGQGSTSFKVNSFDERFHLLEISLGGDLGGSLKAFRRPKPFQQPTIEALRGSVTVGEFGKCRALVLGGSRGLGELTAKLICAGGGTAYLGYYRGREEAQKIADEIKASGLGACHPFEMDIRDLRPATLGKVLPDVNCVYYYPTPPIFKKQPRLFVKKSFEEFADFYFEKFYALCEIIERSPVGKIQVYYPSSTALDQRPNGMTAYAMAKAAAEVMIQDMNRAFKKVNVLCTRLPRLGSDQTNSIMDARREDGVAVLLPIVREIQKRLDES